VNETFTWMKLVLKNLLNFSNRESLIKNVISMEGEKNDIPVEVAMIYNTSYTENFTFYVNNINTQAKVVTLSGFRRDHSTFKETCRCFQVQAG
jgi:DNA gyrase subunit B